MNQRRLIVIGLFMLLATAVIWPMRSPQQNAVLAEAIPDDGLVVRVYFEDPALGRQIAKSFEPLQSNYEKGYLLLAVSQEEYQKLLDANLQAEIDEALTKQYAEARALPPGQIEAIPGFSCYRTVEETFSTAQSIVTNYPTLATWSDVGNSWEKATSGGLPGYDMMVLKLTNSAILGPKPKIFITSAIHAREYTTAELITRLAENLVNGYGTDPDTTWILDYHEVHLMLQTNPDGRKQAETGILWRKNTNQNYCSPTSNSRGADLNRNFTYNWGCCGGSSGSQCNETYRGASAGSEPEVQAVMNYALANFPDQRGTGESAPAPLDATGLYLDIHSSGRLLLWPWGYTSNPTGNGPQLQTLGRKLAYFNGHTPEQAIGLYPTDGTTDDYIYGELGVAAYTYELGTQFFESCSYFTNTLLPANMPSLMYALKVARTPYMTPAGPDTLSVALSQGSTPPGIPAGTVVNLTASINDTRFNNSNGTEPTQAIAAAEYYVDTPPWAGGTAVAMSPSDGNFNSTVEGATASINTTGWSNGRHTLYLRGRDANNNWGAVSAIFLHIGTGPTPTSTPTPGPTATPPPGGTIFFDNFESNLGWTVNPNGSDNATTGQWERGNPEDTNSSGPKQLGTTVSGSNDLVTGRLAGSSAGSYDIDGGTTSIRSPNITLPASGDITLSFNYYLAHGTNSSSADFLRVQVVGSSTQTVFEELGAANNDDAVWANANISLNSFAGQTVHLLISAADASTASLVEAAVDDVLIQVVGGGPTPTNTPAPTNTPTPTITPTPPPGGTVFFDNFETNLGWTVNPNGSDNATTGQWERGNPEDTNSSGPKQLGTTVSGSNDLVTGRLAGSSAGSYDIDGGTTSIRSPNITLPSSGNITLSFSYYLAHGTNSSSADFLRVQVVGSSTQTVFEELGAANDDDAVWAAFSGSLNSFAGQTVYLLISAADASTASLVEAAIDEVQIQFSP